MSNNPSTTTKTITTRVSNEVYSIFERRVKKGNGKWRNVNEYTRYHIEYDALRKR